MPVVFIGQWLLWAGCRHPCRRQSTQGAKIRRCTAARQLRAQMYVPAAVRKCSIARLQEVADMYPACDRLLYFAVALLGVRTRRCLISHLIYDDHLGSQTLGAPYSVPYN